jgi:hypothetical protein
MKKLIIVAVMATSFCLTAFAQMKTTTADRAYWNGFVDYVSAKGLSGSKDLNRHDLDIGHKLFVEYNKLKGRTVNYNKFVTMVQTDIAQYRRAALKQIQISRAKHAENAAYPLAFDGADDEFMKGLSQIDGFAGVLTLGWKFPGEVVAGCTYVKPNDLYYASTR